VRSIKEILIAGRSAAKAKALADDLGPSVRAVDSYEEAITGADIVCACTHSPQPVVRREWLAPGTHVNSVGFTSDGVELDDRTVADALVVVESRASALAPPPAGSNDLLWRIRDGVITPDHIHAEIGELVADIRPGRSSDTQLTLYKSVGVAVQDAAAAALVLTNAEVRNVGYEIAL
jgi:alanine dehydrogenase